jgi:putative peptidoglycan lipid II flippase
MRLTRKGDSGSEAASGGEQGKRPRLGAIALLLAGSVALSRVVGYLREMALANQVGAGPDTDAYYAAFQIPDLLNYLLAGAAFSISFLPVYTRVEERSGRAEADRLFANVLGTLAVITMVATAILWIYADQLVAFQFSAFAPETQALTVRLTRIVLPGQIFLITGGIVRAVLMARGRFATQALAPLLYNGGCIAGGLITGTVEGFAWGILAGAVLGTWLVPILDLRRDQPLRVRVAPWERSFLQYLWVAAPLMLGLSLATVDEWYDRWFGAALGASTVAHLFFARRLMQAPVAVVGQAVSTAALPTLAKLSTTGQSQAFHDTLLGVLRASLAVAVLAAGACLVLAGPLVDVVYHHGRFTAADAERVASILRWMSLAVPGWVVQQVAVRAFFAREDTWRPMILSTLIALAAIPLYLWLGEQRGAEGLALAGALAMSTNAIVTVTWSRLRFGGPDLRALAGSLLRATLVTAPAAAAVHFVSLGIPGKLGALTDLVVGGALFGVLALVGIAVVGDAALREPLQRMVARLRRRS